MSVGDGSVFNHSDSTVFEHLPRKDILVYNLLVSYLYIFQFQRFNNFKRTFKQVFLIDFLEKKVLNGKI